MYRKGITERAIQARTGHTCKSIDALHTYEPVSTEQEKQMYHVLGDVTNQTPLTDMVIGESSTCELAPSSALSIASSSTPSVA